MSKLFDNISLEEINNENNIGISMMDMVISEENMIDVLTIENELKRNMDLIVSSEEIILELMSTMSTVVSSEDITLADVINLKYSYINACKNIGCSPVEISTENIENSLTVSTESIKDVVDKIIQAIKKLYINIKLGIKKLYAKILLIFADDSKKASELLLQFDKAFENGSVPKDSNWRFSEGVRNSLYAKMSGAIFFQGNNEPLSEMLSNILTANLAHINKTDKIRVTFSDKAYGGSPLDEKFADFIVKSKELVFEEGSFYYPVTTNGPSIGIVKLKNGEDKQVASVDYFRVNLLPILAGEKVTSNYRNNGTYSAWNEDYKLLPEKISAGSLAYIAGSIKLFSEAAKDMYSDFLTTMKENENAIEKIDKIIEPTEDNKKELVVLQKIALINNKLMLDDLIGKMKLSKACLKLLSIQSYSFDK